MMSFVRRTSDRQSRLQCRLLWSLLLLTAFACRNPLQSKRNQEAGADKGRPDELKDGERFGDSTVQVPSYPVPLNLGEFASTRARCDAQEIDRIKDGNGDRTRFFVACKAKALDKPGDREIDIDAFRPEVGAEWRQPEFPSTAQSSNLSCKVSERGTQISCFVDLPTNAIQVPVTTTLHLTLFANDDVNNPARPKVAERNTSDLVILPFAIRVYGLVPAVPRLQSLSSGGGARLIGEDGSASSVRGFERPIVPAFDLDVHGYNPSCQTGEDTFVAIPPYVYRIRGTEAKVIAGTGNASLLTTENTTDPSQLNFDRAHGLVCDGERVTMLANRNLIVLKPSGPLEYLLAPDQVPFSSSQSFTVGNTSTSVSALLARDADGNLYLAGQLSNGDHRATLRLRSPKGEFSTLISTNTLVFVGLTVVESIAGRRIFVVTRDGTEQRLAEVQGGALRNILTLSAVSNTYTPTQFLVGRTGESGPDAGKAQLFVFSEAGFRSIDPDTGTVSPISLANAKFVRPDGTKEPLSLQMLAAPALNPPKGEFVGSRIGSDGAFALMRGFDGDWKPIAGLLRKDLTAYRQEGDAKAVRFAPVTSLSMTANGTSHLVESTGGSVKPYIGHTINSESQHSSFELQNLIDPDDPGGPKWKIVTANGVLQARSDGELLFLGQSYQNSLSCFVRSILQYNPKTLTLIKRTPPRCETVEASASTITKDGSYVYAHLDRVQRLNADNTLTLLAGNGTAIGVDYGPDATALSFPYPKGLSFGDDGTLYINHAKGLARVGANGASTRIIGDGIKTFAEGMLAKDWNPLERMNAGIAVLPENVILVATPKQVFSVRPVEAPGGVAEYRVFRFFGNTAGQVCGAGSFDRTGAKGSTFLGSLSKVCTDSINGIAAANNCGTKDGKIWLAISQSLGLTSLLGGQVIWAELPCEN